MPDNLFDNFVNGKLNDHEAPVPGGVWDKITEKQFDEFVAGKLEDHQAPVPGELWDKITDGQLDNLFSTHLRNYAAPVPTGLWDKVSDAQLDHFFADNLDQYIAPVPAGAWAGVEDTRLDHFFAGKLDNYVAPVPEGLWEKIHPEEDERKIAYWWRLPVAASLLLAVLIGGAVGAYFISRPHTDQPTHTSVAGMNKPAASAPGSKQQVPAAAIVPSNTAANNNNTSSDPAANAGVVDQHSNIAASPSSKENKTVSPVDHATSVEDINVGTSHNNFTLAGGKKASGNNLTTANRSLNGGGHDTPFIPAQSNTTPVANTTLPAGSVIAAREADANNDYGLPIRQSSFVPALTISSGRDHQLNFADLTLADNKHTSKFKSNVICPTNRSNRNTDWLLEVYASPDIAIRSMSPGTASTAYLQKKDSSTQMQVGFTGGIRLVKPLTDNILLKTGVQYTQMNEKYAYRSENEIKTTTVVTVRTIIRSPGDTVVVSDTSTLQTVGFKNNTVKNRYRSIDIPLTLGYQFGNDDIKIGINAGVIFNLTSWYQGVILDTSLAFVPITKANNMVYKSKLGLGLYAGVSVSKQLGDDLQIFFEPYFRYNLSNMTTSQAGYNQRFSLGGLSVGLRFNLNR